MIKLYQISATGEIVHVDYGIRGMEKTYLRLGYLILEKRKRTTYERNETAIEWAECLAK